MFMAVPSIFWLENGKWPDGLFIVIAYDDTVGCLDIKLPEMGVHIRLVRITDPSVIHHFAFVNDVHTVIHIGTNRQRYFLIIVAADPRLLIFQDKQHSVRIDNRSEERRVGKEC